MFLVSAVGGGWQLALRRQSFRGDHVRKEGYTHIPVPPDLPKKGLSGLLTAKYLRRVRRKKDWYSTKVHPHFDTGLDRGSAETLVTNPDAVARYAFLPLVAFEKRQRRYRRMGRGKQPRASLKVRRLTFAANRDGYIFAYYAQILGELYEAELARRGLGKAVIGYRKGASNIRLACQAFREIQSRGPCVAIALDIKGFFDNISHTVLKACWGDLLGCGRLPDDHYAVFRALTKASAVDRGELLRRLGIDPRTPDRKLPRPLCTVPQFRALRSDPTAPSKLVRPYCGTAGIPQGTPMSAMAANISMLRFDTAMQAVAAAAGASYRRYSDDILLVCSPEHAASLEGLLRNLLRNHAAPLQINEEKTERVRFPVPRPNPGADAPEKQAKPLQYLGFTFDGRRVLLRSGTVSRFYRHMASAVRAAKAKAALARKNELRGRLVPHRRSLLARHTHLGSGTFITGYARASVHGMAALGSSVIRRQLARHLRVLDTMIRRTP